MRKYDVLVVGAGFAGSVVAERLAAAGSKVLVIDKRGHVAGNAYDFYDRKGVLVHRYGPHVFHTNSDKVWEYLSRFTEWRMYEQRTLAHVDGKLVPIPINMTTVEALYGLDFGEDETKVKEWFEAQADHSRRPIVTSEDSVLSRVGRDLYEKFFHGYTRKQWALDPSQLDAQVCARIPIRTNRDDRYFTDTYQAMPAEGYEKMFRRILDHPNIEVQTGMAYPDVAENAHWDLLVFTGPIDEFFGYRFGPLPYRSLWFEFRIFAVNDFQGNSVINYPHENVPYTRVSEFKHITGQDLPGWTTVAWEHPTSEGDPYYPIPRPQNRELYKRYEELGETLRDTYFVGRLATYQYYNMDQVVAQALVTADRIIEGRD